MSLPFGKSIFGGSATVARPTSAFDPVGRRLLGLTLEKNQPIWSPPGHSILYSANGGGKTTRGLMPWVFSLLASKDRPAILVLDSKDSELSAQLVPMLEKMGVPTAVIDDMGTLPGYIHGRVALNPFDPLVGTHRNAPEDQVFANDTVTQTLIPEPSGKDGPDRNWYWRQSPRAILELAILILLRRNPVLATPGGVWMMVSSAAKLRRFADIELAEGEALAKSLAEDVLDMLDHEHGPQHLQAARDAMRLFSTGTRLHLAGHGATVTHADLIRERRVIFLCGSQAHMGSLGPYYGLHLMAFIRAAYLRAGPLWIGADEFTNAPVRKLVDALTTLRAYGVTVSMIAQSRSEVERKMGRNELLTIEENAIIKQWFGFSNFEEAERVSKAIGDEHAVSSGLSGNSDDMRLQTNLSLTKQAMLSPSELMAMPRDRQLLHIKSIGFYLARTISQANIAPYCDLIADNPLEGGHLPSDPWITLPMPEKAYK